MNEIENKIRANMAKIAADNIKVAGARKKIKNKVFCKHIYKHIYKHIGSGYPGPENLHMDWS